MNINVRAEECSGQSRYNSYATATIETFSVHHFK